MKTLRGASCSGKKSGMIFLLVPLMLAVSECGSDRAAPTSAPAEVQDRIVDVPATIDPTGAEDVTEALMEFLLSLPDSTEVRFAAGGRYRVEGTLLLQNRHALTLEGQGATLFASTDGEGASPPPSLKKDWPQGRRHFLFILGSNITIRNLTIEGSNPNAGTSEAAYREDRAFQHGFTFQGVTGVELDHVAVRNVYGDFVYLGDEGDTWTSGVRIHDSHFEANGRQGIAITGARDVVIERNYIGQVRRSSIDLEPHNEDGGAENIVIRENDFGPGRLKFLASQGEGSNVVEITIESNRLERPMNVVVGAPEGHRRGPFHLINNVSSVPHGSPNALMKFTRIDGLEVRGNVQRLNENRRMTGVQTVQSCEVAISDNQFDGAVQEAEVGPFECE